MRDLWQQLVDNEGYSGTFEQFKEEYNDPNRKLTEEEQLDFADRLMNPVDEKPNILNAGANMKNALDEHDEIFSEAKLLSSDDIKNLKGHIKYLEGFGPSNGAEETEDEYLEGFGPDEYLEGFGPEETSIEDDIIEKQAQKEKIKADEEAAFAANASKYTQDELDRKRKDISEGKFFETNAKGIEVLVEDVWETAKTEEAGNARIAEEMEKVNEEQLKLDKQKAFKEQKKKEFNRTNISIEDFQLEEDEAVIAFNKKYKGRGVTFSKAANFWGGKDKITVTGPHGSKDFLLGSAYNVEAELFGKFKGDIATGVTDTYNDMLSFIDSQTTGASDDMNYLDKVMGPIMEGGTLDEQLTRYKEQIEAIQNNDELDSHEKWVQQSNTPKPTYSDLVFNDENDQWEYKPNEEYLVKVRDKILAIDPIKMKDKASLNSELEKVKLDLIINDPVLKQQAIAIQTKLAPDYKDLAESIRLKHGIAIGETDGAKLAAANTEFQKLSSEMFFEQLDKSLVYKRVVGDINNAFNETANHVSHIYDRRHLGGFGGFVVDAIDGYNFFAKGTMLEKPVSAATTLVGSMTLGFGGQTGKSWNATQISMAQFKMKGIKFELDKIKDRGDDEVIEVYANGDIKSERQSSKWSIGQAPATPNPANFNWKGQLETGIQGVYGGEMKSNKMTVGEYRKQQKEYQDSFKEDITGDLHSIRAYEKILEQAPVADFSDGISINDIIITIGQVLPQVVISTAGVGLASFTGGASLVASTMFMFGNEYGNNYWDGLVTGLTKDLGREPSDEEIVQALLDDKYSEQGVAAGWAAISAILEQGTGIRSASALKNIGKQAKRVKGMTKVLNTVAKKSGFTGIKDMMVKTGKNQFMDMLKQVPRTGVAMTKGGIKEYLTEFTQELTGQASTGVIADGDVMARIDLESANEAGTGGSIVGFFLPGFGGMYRGGKTTIREAAKTAAVGLNAYNSNLFSQSAASTKQTRKFFSDAALALKKLRDNGTLSSEDYQQESENLANIRNAANKIPKNWSMEGRQEGLELMQTKERLEGYIKDNKDVFTEASKAELKNVNNKLMSLTEIENATSMAQKAVKGSGQNVEVIRAKNTREANQQLKNLGFSKAKIQKIRASNKFGIHVSKNPKTGKRTIILNEELIRNRKQWTTAQHEVLHDVLRETLKGNNRNVFALENALAQKLKQINPSKIANSDFAKRLTQYHKRRAEGKITPADAAEEALTLFSEALATGDIKFEEGGFTKVKDMIRRLFQSIAPGSRLGKIEFKNEEDVYNFIKDYNKSIKKGKFTRAQKELYSSGAKISENLGKTKKQIKEGDIKTVAPTGEAIDIEPSILASIDEDIDELVDEGADPMIIAEKFRGSLRKLANSMYSGNAKWNTMKDQLLDELIFDSVKGRGTTSLVKEYLKKKAEGKIPEGQTMGQFVMGHQAGMPQKIKDIAARVLGFASEEDIDSVIKTKKDFSQDEKSSLRKELEIFSPAELNLMLKRKQITQDQYNALQEKSKLYDKVIDGVKKIFGGKLPTVKSGKLIQVLEKEFADFFETQIKEIMGTPNSTQYKEFLEKYGDKIFNKLSQRTVNKKFAALKEPVLGKNGKQERILTDEALAEGSRVKDKYSGPLKFKKKKLKEGEFVEYHLNPKKGRPSSKRNTLAQALAAELGFDAAQQVLKTPVDTDLETGIETTLADARSEVFGEDVVTAEIESLARDLGRGVEYKFSEVLDEDKSYDNVAEKMYGDKWDNLNSEEQTEVVDAVEGNFPLSRIPSQVSEYDRYARKMYSDKWDNLTSKEQTKVVDAVEGGFPVSKIIKVDLAQEIESFLTRGAKQTWSENKWQNEFAKLPLQVQEAMEKHGYTYLFSPAVIGYKSPLLSTPWGKMFEKYKDAYGGFSLSPLGPTYQVALEDMGEFVGKLMENIDPVFLKFMKKPFFALLKGKGVLGGLDSVLYEELLAKYDLMTQEVTQGDIDNFIAENGFDPSKVILLNANKGLYAKMQKEGNNTRSLSAKQNAITQKYGKDIRGLDENNPKALAYFYTKILETVMEDHSLITGAMRLMESNTSNVGGPRGLTKSGTIMLMDGISLAPFEDPDTGKHYSSRSDVGNNQEIRDRLIINPKHPFLEDVQDAVSESYQKWLNGKTINDRDVSKEEAAAKWENILYQKLRWKGEHEFASALLNYEISKLMLKYLPKLATSEDQGKLLEQFSAEIEKLGSDYKQELMTKYITDLQDTKHSPTSKRGAYRTAGMETPSGWVVDDILYDPLTGKTKAQTRQEGVQNKVNKENLERTTKDSIDEDVDMLNDSRVLNISENTTMDEILDKAARIDEALRKARNLDQPVKGISVLDFDDTLATTKSNILYTTSDGKKGKLTAEEFAKKGAEMEAKGVTWDFSEFNKVVDGKTAPLFQKALKLQKKFGSDNMFVLTARAQGAAKAIYEFLKANGLNIPLKNITGLADSRGLAKANWMVDKAAEGYNDFYFADDAIQNVDAVQQVLDVVDVKSKVQQAKIKFSENLDQEFNDIIEQTTGLKSWKAYSRAKAEVKGASKGKFKFWIPPSAEDFVGLIYKTLGKGEIGDTQMAWWKQNILNPYARAMSDLSTARLNLMNDFRKLKKTLKVPKELKKVGDDGFKNEHAVRVYLWNKNGIEVPGLSKTDLKNLIGVVENNPILKEFADQLEKINKEAYPKPGDHWLVGSITSDLIEGLNTTKRERYLEQWKQNVDKVFSEKNLNKLEAIHGPKYRAALENILQRMKSGKNRTTSGNKLTNRVLDYINGSNAAIMFFNTRSAVLQTISAINFINWSFNNPYQAGKAFANQPQYWKDFVELMNSDYLKDRRNGLRLNITESEVAEAAKTATNKAKGVLAYILKKGYLPTQYADSFAIASGGATFYRNRINQLLKEGKTESEAKEIAMLEFRQISEESQQSSDPSRISSQQASSLGRLILMFANTPMQYARIQKRAFQDLVNGRGDAKSNVSKIVYYGFIQNLLFNGLQQALFALGMGDDEEEDIKKISNTVNGMLDSQLRGLGFGGAAISAVKNFLLNIYERSGRSRPQYKDAVWELLKISPPISSKITKLRGAAYPFDSKDRRQEIKDKGFSIDNPAYESLAKVVSATLNIPLDRVLQKFENIKVAMEEDTAWWQSVAMIGGWPNWVIKPDAEKVAKKKERKEKKKISDTKKIEKEKQEKLDAIEKEKREKGKGKSRDNYKHGRIPKAVRTDQEDELYDLNKEQQEDSLTKLDSFWNKKRLRNLTEGDRVEAIIQENE